MASLRKSVLEAATEDDVQAVIRKMAEMGRDGDVMAARCYLEYTVGKPTQAIELTGPEGGPVDLRSVMGAVMLALGDFPEARFRVAQEFSRIGALADESGNVEQPGADA
jgi:hypothetical protein